MCELFKSRVLLNIYLQLHNLFRNKSATRHYLAHKSWPEWLECWPTLFVCHLKSQGSVQTPKGPKGTMDTPYIKVQCVKFRMNDLQEEQVISHIVRHVALLFFYCSPEQINQTPALSKAAVSPTHLDGQPSVAICSLSAKCH